MHIYVHFVLAYSMRDATHNTAFGVVFLTCIIFICVSRFLNARMGNPIDLLYYLLLFLFCRQN